MTVTFRDAGPGDVAAVVALLRDDSLGAVREDKDAALYDAAFAAMQAEGANTLVVGEREGEIVATYQITFITGLSHRATRRAQVESVRVATHLRGQGIGHQLMEDAERRAVAGGCAMVQLTTHASRNRAREFYDAVGYDPTHVGYKKFLPRDD